MNHIELYPLSATIYILTMIIAVLLAKYAQNNSNSRSGKTAFVLIIIVLSLLAGFRAASVGTDTAGYFEQSQMLESGIQIPRYTLELGYRVLVWLIMFVTSSEQMVFIVFAFIINSFIIATLWKYKKEYSFTYALFCYIGMFYLATFSGIRQWVAVAIVFYATTFLVRKSYLRYCIYILIASSIHWSALFAYAFIPLHFYFINNRLDILRKIFMALVVCLFGLFFIVIIPDTIIFSKFAVYLDSNFRLNQSGLGLMFLAKVFIVAYYMMFYKKRYYFLNDKIVPFATMISIISIPFVLGGYYWYFVGRLTWYLSIYLTIFYAKAIKLNSNIGHKSLMLISTLVVVLYTFFIGLVYNGNKIMPYIFFWS